jgi:hypothetical protein
MENQINDHVLWKEAKSLAVEILAEFKSEHEADYPDEAFDPDNYRDEMIDRIWETVDGHQWVIYYHHAIQLCANCNTDEGEVFLEDTGGTQAGDTFGGIACKIAFGELYFRTCQELNEMIDEGME